MRWLLMMLLALVLTGGVLTGGVYWLTKPGDQIDAGLEGDAARGEVIAHIGGCIACHTDFKNGGALLAGGPPMKTDFGSFVPPNITPDFEAGIGHWQVADLSRALRLGISPDGTHYYPAFPYDYYTQMQDQDVVDLFEWLRTVPAVATPAPNHELSFPFNQRAGLIAWQALYLSIGRFEARPEQTAEWNRGAYLVEVVGHCAACHTQRDLLGGPVEGGHLAGAKGLPGGESAPAITAEALAKRGFDAGGVSFALEIGMLPDGDFFGGSMTKVVDHGTAKLSAEDRAAIAAYLLNPVDG